jgi:adenylylsulfate kinase-like enzyme
MPGRAEAVILGGRSGAGKSSVGYEIHAQLSAADVQHCLRAGDGHRDRMTNSGDRCLIQDDRRGHLIIGRHARRVEFEKKVVISVSMFRTFSAGWLA